MDFSASSSFDYARFISDWHQERFKILVDRNIIEERAFHLSPDEYHEIHSMLKKHRHNYMNSQIHHVAKNLVLKFYSNAYKPPYENTITDPELVSWVRGRQIHYDWNMVNKMMKMKFREPNCQYLLHRTLARSGWPYRAMLDLLALHRKYL